MSAETVVMSFRLTPKEREYLYHLGGGTSRAPDKSANLALRGLLAYVYRREAIGALSAKWFAKNLCGKDTILIDDIKAEEVAKAKAELEAGRAKKAAFDAEIEEWNKRGAAAGMRPFEPEAERQVSYGRDREDAESADLSRFSAYKYRVTSAEANRPKQEKLSDFD